VVSCTARTTPELSRSSRPICKTSTALWTVSQLFEIVEQALETLHFIISPLLTESLRHPGLSKGFGFAQFTTVEHARAFLEPNFPFVNMPPPASHGASATAAFKTAMENGGHHGGRRVKIDFSQSAHGSDRGRPRMPSNDGTRDIGTSPSTLVLLRGLDPITIPATVALALRSAAGPGKDGSKGMRRIMLIKDKTTGLGCGFVFLEFVDQSVSFLPTKSVIAERSHRALRLYWVA
jgi:RNA-binding protein 5/10